MNDEAGIIKVLLPPDNDGTATGTGEILSNRVTYTFNTPTANNDHPLIVNRPCTFTIEEDGVVTNVNQEG